MIENSILIIVSSFCMGRMIISYVDFRSCHKHFPNSLPLCQMNHAHNAHCHQMWLVGGVGPLNFHPDIYPDNCRGGIITGQQITMLQPVAVLGWWIDC